MVLLLDRPLPSIVCEELVAARADEPLTIVIYTDFLCPSCARLDRALRPYRGAHALNLVTRQYPLDRDCNARIQRTKHPGSCLDARAAICSEGENAGPTFREHLFDERPADREEVLQLASRIGFDTSRFPTCLDAVATIDRLQRDIEAAAVDHIRATPTLVINGRRHIGELRDWEVECVARASTEGRTIRGHFESSSGVASE